MGSVKLISKQLPVLLKSILKENQPATINKKNLENCYGKAKVSARKAKELSKKISVAGLTFTRPRR